MVRPANASELIAAGLSESMAHHVLAGTRKCSVPVALWLHDEKRLRVPQLEGLSKRELDGLRSVFSPAPPKRFVEAASTRSAA